MSDPVKAPSPNEILHSEHSHLTTADIAKAVARHKREHPTPIAPPSAPKSRPIPQKTTPRG